MASARTLEIVEMQMHLIKAEWALARAATAPVINNPVFESKINRDGGTGQFAPKPAGTLSNTVSRATKAMVPNDTPVGKGAQKLMDGEVTHHAFGAMSRNLFKLGEGMAESASGKLQWGKDVVVQSAIDSSLNKMGDELKDFLTIKTPEDAKKKLGTLVSKAAPAAVSFLLMGVAPEVLMGASIGLAFETAAVQIAAGAVVERGTTKLLDSLDVKDPTERILIKLATMALTGAVVRSGMKALKPAIAKKLKDVQAAYEANQKLLKEELALAEKIRKGKIAGLHTDNGKIAVAETERALRKLEKKFKEEIDEDTRKQLEQFVSQS